MYKGIIKKTESPSQVEPFSFASFDEGADVEREEEDLEALAPSDVSESSAQEGSSEVNADRPELEAFRPPDIEQIILKKLHEAESEAQKIKSRAFEEGRDEGYRVGYEQGLEDARRIVEECKNLMEFLGKLPASIMNDYKEWLIDAAFTIAKHIIQEELSTKPQTFLAHIGRLVKEMEDDLPITIFLNPEDLSLLSLSTDFDEWARGQGKILKLAPDDSLERGSCRMESNVALIDATLDKVLKEMKQDVLTELVTQRGDASGTQ